MEDDQILRKMYQNKFANSGYELIVAEDGEQGLRKVNEARPDFILLDLMMPKVSGIQVLKELQSDEKNRTIPLAILSVIPREDSLLDGSAELLKDIVGYYRKDENDPSDILKKVKEYFENK